MKKVGIIICNRYHTCAGANRLRALRDRERVFALYERENTTVNGIFGAHMLVEIHNDGPITLIFEK